MKTVILCGGLGTRLKEETEYKPKPLVKIGQMPIIWHIMKTYSHYGFKDFVLCLGYKGELIKEFFLNYAYYVNDFTLNLKGRHKLIHDYHCLTEDWNIVFADTGLDTLTAGRLKKVQKYINEDQFMFTYGDAVANIDIKKLLDLHNQKNKIGTITGLYPRTKYGIIDVDDNNLIRMFKEKPILNDLINGGFMVFRKEIFDEIKEDCMLVKKTLPNLAKKNQLAFYKHEGFWHCMDTYKDYQDLNHIWNSGNVPWRIWK